MKFLTNEDIAILQDWPDLKNNQTYLERVENIDFCPFIRLHWTEVLFLLTELFMGSSGRV